MTMRIGAVAAVILLFLPATRPLAAQSERGRGQPRLYVSLYGGTTSPGPARDLEAAFAREQLNELPSCGVVLCTEQTYPYSKTGWGQTGLPYAVQVRLRIVGPAEIGVVVGHTPIGETVGYHYPLLLDIQYGVTILAATAGVTVPLPLPRAPRFYLDAGPARYGAFWIPLRDNQQLFTAHEKTSGWLASTGFEVPVARDLSVGFDFQYRKVGTVTVGPVALPTAVNQHDLPAILTNYDHWCAAIGFSIALWSAPTRQ